MFYGFTHLQRLQPIGFLEYGVWVGPLKPETWPRPQLTEYLDVFPKSRGTLKGVDRGYI